MFGFAIILTIVGSQSSILMVRGVSWRGRGVLVVKHTALKERRSINMSMLVTKTREEKHMGVFSTTKLQSLNVG